jgi:hypothetical protein
VGHHAHQVRLQARVRADLPRLLPRVSVDVIALRSRTVLELCRRWVELVPLLRAQEREAWLRWTEWAWEPDWEWGCLQCPAGPGRERSATVVEDAESMETEGVDFDDAELGLAEIADSLRALQDPRQSPSSAVELTAVKDAMQRLAAAGADPAAAMAALGGGTPRARPLPTTRLRDRPPSVSVRQYDWHPETATSGLLSSPSEPFTSIPSPSRPPRRKIAAHLQLPAISPRSPALAAGAARAISPPCVQASHFHVGDGEAGALADVIGSTDGEQIERISLSDNCVQGKGCEVLVHSLRGRAKLKHLDLSYNRIGMQGALALAAALREPWCRIQSLNVSANNLGDRAFAALCRGLEASPSIRSFYAASNGIMNSRPACALLHLSDSIAALDLSWNSIRERDMVRSQRFATDRGAVRRLTFRPPRVRRRRCGVQQASATHCNDSMCSSMA